MKTDAPPLSTDRCSRARLSRDVRFDGLFFVAVKTTGIFCRPICPAPAPKESNVQYFSSALEASQAGFRPCLRCRPEAAPGSPAWRGTGTTLARAVRLIDEGAWCEQSLSEFSERLGVSDRYLRKLFQDELGLSPLRYLNFRRVLLAKQLLQQSSLAIGDIAIASGFGSVRRFNAAFNQLMGMAPREVRRSGGSDEMKMGGEGALLFLCYRPPYDWSWLQRFLAQRAIEGLEQVTDDSYRRTIQIGNARGAFVVTHCAERHGFRVQLWLDRPELTAAAIAQVRRILDLDADRDTIANHLGNCPALAPRVSKGLPLPGIWSPFEAGVRAILGQQVSVLAARQLVEKLVSELGEPLNDSERLFPAPGKVASSSLSFLRMPNSRRETLRDFAAYLANGGEEDPNKWLALKGIGPWTVDYVRMRMGDPDIWLASDLGVRKGLELLAGEPDPEQWRPWSSYASLQMWRLLEQDCGEKS
ncbi:AlkA N-terminal domain-containing protein [Porticoccaceae bacterium LTM1]|nr:AlkA N-terminal domain-containing protein [Porticoccaceae bacterium LTM1]